MTVDPREIDWQRWVSQTVAQIKQVIPFDAPRGVPEDQWQRWAVTVATLSPTIAATSPPLPEFFPDWRTWAARFNESLMLLGVI